MAKALPEIHSFLAKNILELRKKRKLTQTQLAQRSGIPRSTLTLIESGISNPTLHNLIKLSEGLSVPIEELLSKPRSSAQLFLAQTLPRQSRQGGVAEITNLLPDKIPGLQFEKMTLKPRALMTGSPHIQHSKEYFYCIEGNCEIVVAGERFRLGKGDLLAFSGDQAHSYRNLKQSLCVGISIVSIAM